jgi:hypothetical protein
MMDEIIQTKWSPDRKSEGLYMWLRYQLQLDKRF